MDTAGFSELRTWLTEAGLAGKSETALLDGFCRLALDAGLPIGRAAIVIDTLHPVHEGRAFLWRREGKQTQTELVEYGPTSEGEMAENWRRSVFFHLLQTGGSLFRVRFHAGETADFFNFAKMRDEGMTDVAAMITRFPGSGAIGEMDSLYSYWATDRPHGFDDAHVEAIAGLVPMLALAVKCVSLARIAGTLVETYLGRDAGQRVLKGLIRRGVADRISAVLWYSDLREFTRITDQSPPEQIIPLLDDYAEAVISAIYDNGGDVLKRLAGAGLPNSTSAGPVIAWRRQMSMSACISAKCSTAISAATNGWTSRWSARLSTRSPASRRCAGRWSAMCCSLRPSQTPWQDWNAVGWSPSAVMRCAASSGRRSCSRSIRSFWTE